MSTENLTETKAVEPTTETQPTTETEQANTNLLNTVPNSTTETVATEEVNKTDETERPTWLPEKFKNAEDMAKAYGELENKLGQSQDNNNNSSTLYKSRPRSHFELDRIRFFSSLPPLNPRVGKNKKRESRAALSS